LSELRPLRQVDLATIPRDLLKLYLYGYLNQIRSSRRLEAECRRNVELMWLLGRLYPDHKSIAEFRRMHRDAVTAAGAELVRFARGCGLIQGEWIAIDGSKFRAVASDPHMHVRLPPFRGYFGNWCQGYGSPRLMRRSTVLLLSLRKLHCR
jgi:hypothetical protein